MAGQFAFEELSLSWPSTKIGNCEDAFYTYDDIRLGWICGRTRPILHLERGGETKLIKVVREDDIFGAIQKDEWGEQLTYRNRESFRSRQTHPEVVTKAH